MQTLTGEPPGGQEKTAHTPLTWYRSSETLLPLELKVPCTRNPRVCVPGCFGIHGFQVLGWISKTGGKGTGHSLQGPLPLPFGLVPYWFLPLSLLTAE